MRKHDQAAWFKSSFSGPDGNCVEVAFIDDAIAVRDTKDRTLTPHVYNRAEWQAFIDGVKAGEFDL